MKTTICILAFFAVISLLSAIAYQNYQWNKYLDFQMEYKKLEVKRAKPVYYDNSEVSGQCGLSLPPCWEDFTKHVLRIK